MQDIVVFAVLSFVAATRLTCRPSAMVMNDELWESLPRRFTLRLPAVQRMKRLRYAVGVGPENSIILKLHV